LGQLVTGTMYLW